ncbi:MAG: hypothetical protein OXG25_08720 [Gammaproteobacteria bacterium]|nr:hypothetical protein [Gammaproteobacteria bacterium]
MSQYRQERRVFDRLREDLSTQAKEEYELSIAALLERYNTTIHENRFVVGGAVEVFTCALLRSVGIDCTLYADQAKYGDILLPNDRKLSVKGSFVGGIKSVKLINKLGGGRREWTTATLFVVAEVGIIYGNPDLVADEHIQDVSDGTQITAAGMRLLSENPMNVLEMEILRKPPTEMTGFSHKASTAVARQILQDIQAEGLLSTFPS